MGDRMPTVFKQHWRRATNQKAPQREERILINALETYKHLLRPIAGAVDATAIQGRQLEVPRRPGSAVLGQHMG